MPTRKSGFTLIELLVVIAIIAILAAILFPVFARAREKARETSCLSNVRQIMLGMQMYVQDHNGMYPMAYFSGSDLPGGGMSWAMAVMPYVRQGMREGIWWCPSSGLDRSMWQSGHSAYVQYGYSAQIHWAGASPFSPPRHESAIPRPSETVVLAETQTSGTNYGNYAWFGFTSAHSRYSHNERMNLGFADGRAAGTTRSAGVAAYTSNGFPN